MEKALPLQIHPDRQLAKQLHERDPKKFTDTNHKPEIAIALSKFELFAGWKPLNDLTFLFQQKPLQRFLPSPQIHFNDETLKHVARNLLEAPDSVVAETINALMKLPESAFGKYTYIPSMLDRVRKQYTEFDNGNLVAVLCMNFFTLGPGDSVYIPADGIHAYLSGDIVECMARSDNVLNTGFCPRAERDSVAVFTEALTFWPHDPDEALLGRRPSGKTEKGKTLEYAPPISEFHVLATHLNAGETEVHKPINGPSILFVTSGDGKMHAGGKTIDLTEGYVFFVGHGIGLEFESSKGIAVYRAYAE
jgi:mannose-6-phosphate isomerase